MKNPPPHPQPLDAKARPPALPFLPSIRLLIRVLGARRGLRFRDAKLLPLPVVPVDPGLLLCPLLGDSTSMRESSQSHPSSRLLTAPPRSLSKTSFQWMNYMLSLTLSHPPACRRNPRVIPTLSFPAIPVPPQSPSSMDSTSFTPSSSGPGPCHRPSVSAGALPDSSLTFLPSSHLHLSDLPK